MKEILDRHAWVMKTVYSMLFGNPQGVQEMMEKVSRDHL